MNFKDFVYGNIDKVQHFVLGILSISCSIIGLYIYQTYGIGWFAAYIATTVGILYEVQQWYRKEGYPSVYDALATSLPGWLMLLWTKIG